jgi:hypothetical protein
MSDDTPALEALNTACERLKTASVESPRRNAEILLSQLLGMRAYEIYLARELVMDSRMVNT